MSAKHTFKEQFPGQHEGETVTFLFRQHPLVMRKQLIFGLAAITLGVLPLDFYGIWYQSEAIHNWLIKLALLVPVVVFVVWFHRWVGWYYSLYIVTDQRIVQIKQKGFFDRAVQEWQLDKIYNVNYHVDGFQAVIFGYGTITAQTIIGDVVMDKIHRPTEVHRQLLDAVRAAGGGQSTPFDKPRQLM